MASGISGEHLESFGNGVFPEIVQYGALQFFDDFIESFMLFIDFWSTDIQIITPDQPADFLMSAVFLFFVD